MDIKTQIFVIALVLISITSIAITFKKTVIDNNFEILEISEE